MSIRAIVWAFNADCPGATAKLVLIKLADCANDEGECWPSQAHIAADTGLARETVNRQVKLLEKAGFLRAEMRNNGAGRLPNRYFLLCEQGSLGRPQVTQDHSPSDARSHKPYLLNPQPTLNRVGETSARATRLAEGFEVPQDWLDAGYAARVKAHMPPGDLATEAIKFANYFLAKGGRDGAKRDWRRTWINWCLNAKGEQSHGKQRFDRRAEWQRRHQEGLDLLAKAAIDHDERKSRGGDLETLA